MAIAHDQDSIFKWSFSWREKVEECEPCCPLLQLCVTEGRGPHELQILQKIAKSLDNHIIDSHLMIHSLVPVVQSH